MANIDYNIIVFGKTVTKPPILVALLQIIWGLSMIVIVPLDFVLRARGRRGMLSRQPGQALRMYFPGSFSRVL